MTGEDWLREYEEAVASLPTATPIAELTEAEARAAARRAWNDEVEARADRDLLLRAVKKVRRALADKERCGEPIIGLPALTPEEAAAARDALLWHRRAFGLAVDVPLHSLLREWVDMFDVTRGLRGAGRPEWRPGLFAAAFVLCDWFAATRGRPPRAMLYRKDAEADVDDWSARDDGVAYDPSADVVWLAAELVQLDPTLADVDDEGRPLDQHQADNFIGLWREARGLSLARSAS